MYHFSPPYKLTHTRVDGVLRLEGILLHPSAGLTHVTRARQGARKKRYARVRERILWNEIAGGARRIVAFVVDGIIVGIAGSVVALPFFETFSHLGPWGRLVGFFMALPYFAILNSAIGNGQTLGKRWMHLQVVDVHGNTISFLKSLIRYAVFAVPYYLNEISLPVTRTPWIVSSLIAVLIFAVGGATLYLVLFNRHTRQGIHDLAAGSYVADEEKMGPLKTQAIWRLHWASIAKVAMGRRLAVRLYWMWRNGCEYLQPVEFGSHAGQLVTGHGVK